MSNYRKIRIKDKRGQIGETVTWIVATLIIVGIMLIFLWISFAMSKFKAVNVGDVRTDLSTNSERLVVKTSIAEQINNQNKATIDNILKQQNG